ncbi:hypothetical protein [Azospirillum palustre]
MRGATGEGIGRRAMSGREEGRPAEAGRHNSRVQRKSGVLW